MSDWSTFLPQVVSGAIVAMFVATLALLVTDRYASRREEAQARRDRGLAAAADFYRTVGEFFAVWKAWEFHTAARRSWDRVPATPQRREQLLDRAASAEGNYESLVVRIALEHDLDSGDAAALWSLRFAFKQLRRAVRADRELKWRRDRDPKNHGVREYEAFKILVAIVANLLVESNPRGKRTKGRDRARTLQQITSKGDDFTHDPRYSGPIENERRLRGDEKLPTGWAWYVIAEHLRR